MTLSWQTQREVPIEKPGMRNTEKKKGTGRGREIARIDTEGIRTPAGTAQWISSPSPQPLGHSVLVKDLTYEYQHANVQYIQMRQTRTYVGTSRFVRVIVAKGPCESIPY